MEINAAAENPLFAGGRRSHHGGFHAAPCALALDTVRLALVSFAGLSSARLSHLMAPALTGLAPFLAVDEPGTSGVLIAEYLAADALGRLRAEAIPAVLGARLDLARAGGARELRLAGRVADPARRRAPAHAARARVGRRRRALPHSRRGREIPRRAPTTPLPPPPWRHGAESTCPPGAAARKRELLSGPGPRGWRTARSAATPTLAAPTARRAGREFIRHRPARGCAPSTVAAVMTGAGT